MSDSGSNSDGKELGVAEPTVAQVQQGVAGTVVTFDLQTAQVFASIMRGWAVISSETPESAAGDNGALVTSWLPYLQAPSPSPWCLVPPADPALDRDTYELISAWLKEAASFGLTDVHMCVTIGPPADWAGNRPPEIVARAVSGAPLAKLPARRPAARKPPAARRPATGAGRGMVVLDPANAQVRGADEVDELGQTVPGPVLMSGACPIVTSVETEQDDLVPGQRAVTKFRLAMVLPDGSVVPVSQPVPLSDLPHINKWLEFAERPEAVTIMVDPKVTTGPAIAAALQASAAEAEKSIVRPRTGLLELDGRIYYLTSVGGLSPDGVSRRCRADVDYNVDFTPGLKGDPVTAWRKAMSVGDRFYDPTPYYATIAFGAGVMAGSPPHGSLALIGGPSAGKTTLLRSAIAIFGGVSSAWSGTDLAMGALLSGCHHIIGLVDDIPPKVSEREQHRQIIALDHLLRRGYDEKTEYVRLQPDSSRPSGTRRAPSDLSAPGICLSLEAIPDGLSPSARERCLVWEVDKITTWRDHGWEDTKRDWVGTDLPITAGAHLVMAITRAIQELGSLARWHEYMSSELPDSKAGKQIISSIDKRIRDKLFAYWVGLDVLMSAWENIGVPDGEVEEWGYKIQAALVKWSKGVHQADINDNWGNRLTDSIKAALLSGRATLAPSNAVLPPGVVRIGEETQDGIALVPKLVAQVLNQGVDIVQQGLRELCGTAKPTRFGPIVVRAFIIPVDKWYPGGRPKVEDDEW